MFVVYCEAKQRNKNTYKVVPFSGKRHNSYTDAIAEKNEFYKLNPFTSCNVFIVEDLQICFDDIVRM